MREELDQLWESITRDNIQAFEKLYKLIYSPLLHYANAIVFDLQLSQEVVQDVFVRLWQKRTEIMITTSLKSYLFRSVHNQALNILKQQESNKGTVNKPCSEEIWKFIENNYQIDENTLDQIYMGELENVLKDAVKSLPEKCREVFFMSRIDGMSNEKIAIKLGLSEHSVKSHIYRALQRISNFLKDNL